LFWEHAFASPTDPERAALAAALDIACLIICCHILAGDPWLCTAKEEDGIFGQAVIHASMGLAFVDCPCLVTSLVKLCL
jgi:hypothetical protein